MNVGMTGARTGDVLCGVANASSGDTANVLLRIETGEVPAPGIIRRSVEEAVGRERVIAAFAMHFCCSHATAEIRYADCPVDENAANHRALGSGCNHSPDAESMCQCEPAATFTILSQGAWQEFADAHGHGDALRAMVEEGRHVCWRDVLALMQTVGQPGGKTLILRPRLFEVTVAPVALSADDPRLVAAVGSAASGVIECVPPWDGASHASGAVYDLVDGHLARLPAPAAAPFAKADVSLAVLEALNGGGNGRPLAVDVTSAEVEMALDALRHLTTGGLKSLMQKAVRFHAKQVELAPALHAPAALVAAACAAVRALVARTHGSSTSSARSSPPLLSLTGPGFEPHRGKLLFAEKGSFSPELQLFTRG